MPRNKPAVYQVIITQGAEADISSIVDYLLTKNESELAAQLLQEFAKAFNSLEQLPHRGHFPPELAELTKLTELADKHIRELHVSVYRLIYRITEQDVLILFVADGRRNIQQALVNRALRLNQ